MRFVRGGVVNPLMRLPRSNLLTVGYRIHDGYLERLAWPLTDAAGSVKPTMQKLIPADSLRLQFYDGTRWQESWSSVQAIPVAVRMTLHSPPRTLPVSTNCVVHWQPIMLCNRTRYRKRVMRFPAA